MNHLPKDQLEAVIRKFGVNEGPLNKAAKHHLCRSGKRTRANLTFAAARHFEGVQSLIHISAAVELLHEASVVHDDIQDRTNIRRGQATVWRKFGSNTALLLGDHLIAAAFSCLGGSGCSAKALPGLVQAMAEATSFAASGQLQQLGLKTDKRELRDQYTTLARRKTGALVALPLQFAAVLAAGDCRVTNYARHSGEQLGLAYQIVNDLQPFRSPATLASHEDMVDRIVTAPVVAVAENNQAQDAFSQLLHSAEVRQHAIRRCEVWVRQAVASARSHAAYTPAPIANVVEQFIAQHLTDPSVFALPTKAASMAQLTPMLAEA